MQSVRCWRGRVCTRRRQGQTPAFSPPAQAHRWLSPEKRSACVSGTGSDTVHMHCGLRHRGEGPTSLSGCSWLKDISSGSGHKVTFAKKEGGGQRPRERSHPTAKASPELILYLNSYRRRRDESPYGRTLTQERGGQTWASARMSREKNPKAGKAVNDKDKKDFYHVGNYYY